MSLQYIIDGYNVINHPVFIRSSSLKDKDPRIALPHLIKTKKLGGSIKNKISVVFDGYPPGEFIPGTQDNLTVIFSRKISADEKIKKLVEESSGRKSMVIVSDDKELKFSVRHLGARVIGVDEFISGKDKAVAARDEESKEITYTQMHNINEELKRLWCPH